MPDFVYLNDKVVPAAEARVSVFDHGFLYGDGLFETMRACGEQVHLLEEHLDRLYSSAEVMKMELPWSREDLGNALAEVLAANGLENSAVRLTVTRGEGLPVPDSRTCKRPTLVITCRHAPPPEGEAYQKGVEVVLLKTRRSYNEAFPVSVKSCNFLNNIFARQELREKGAYEGLMLNYQGYLTEGTVNNVFFVKEGKLLTPSLDCGILNGVTRRWVINKAAGEKIIVEEGFFLPEEIMEAEEAFLTNSVSLIVPVRCLEGRKMKEVPGPVTEKLYRILTGEFAKNTGK